MTPAFLDLVNLAADRLGAAVVAANDEFFGEKDRLLDPKPATWIEDRYTDRGKWMDGWETRRRREPGHDWCIVRLGVRGSVKGLDVDTAFFKGNFPEACAVDVLDDPQRTGHWDQAAWREILPRSVLRGDTRNLFEIEGAPAASHLRLRIFPDGGVARLRVYGDVCPDWPRLAKRGELDLAAIENGAFVVACSDMFFGHRHNVIMPGDARTMGEGWETRRRRGGGHDWTIVRLAAPGTISRAEIDTRHFKGNAPGECDLEAATSGDDPLNPGVAWQPLLPRRPLHPNMRHLIDEGLHEIPGIRYVRFNIYPDGGVARLRLYGRLS